MIVRDRSNGTEGTIQPHLGGNHLATSDPAAKAGQASAYIGDGKQANREADIPETVPALAIPDVALVEGEPKPRIAVEPCHGSVDQNAPALKSLNPSQVRYRQGLAKGHGVSTHPELNRAHQMGSITKDNAKDVHNRHEPMSTVAEAPESRGTLMPKEDGAETTTMGVALNQPNISKVEKAQDSAAPSGDDIAPGLSTTVSRDDKLALAHMHSTLAMSDHVSLHRGDTLAPLRQPISDAALETGIPAVVPLSTPPLGVTKAESASTPVVARMSGRNVGLPVRALPTRPGSNRGPVTAHLDGGHIVTSRG